MSKKTKTKTGSNSCQQTGLLNQRVVLGQWRAVNQRLDQTLERELEFHPSLDGWTSTRWMKLIELRNLLPPRGEFPRLDQIRDVIEMTIDMDRQMTDRLGSNGPASVSLEVLAGFTNDLGWLSTQLTAVFKWERFGRSSIPKQAERKAS